LKVWFAGCIDHDCSCFVLYDHEPSEEDLEKHFCYAGRSKAVVGEVELEELLNRKMSEIYLDLLIRGCADG